VGGRRDVDVSAPMGLGCRGRGARCLLVTAVTHRQVGTTPLRLQELTTARAPSPAGHGEQQLATLVVALAGT